MQKRTPHENVQGPFMGEQGSVVVDHPGEAFHGEMSEDYIPYDDAGQRNGKGNAFDLRRHDEADGFVDPGQGIDERHELHDGERRQLVPRIEDAAEEDDGHEEAREHGGNLGRHDDGADEQAQGGGRDSRQDEYQDQEGNVPGGHLDGDAAAHENQGNGQHDEPPDEGFQDADGHLREGHGPGGNRREEAVLDFTQVVEVHGNRYGRAVDAGDQHGHADHAAEHMGREPFRQNADGGKHPAVDQNQNKGEHGHAEHEFPLVAPLHEKVPSHHCPECFSCQCFFVHLVYSSTFALCLSSTPSRFVRTRNTSLSEFVFVLSSSSFTVP